MLIVAGAGLSSDGGIPLYEEMCKQSAFQEKALGWPELVDPQLFAASAEQAYGFWGWYYNACMDTDPHQAFEILYRWRKELFVGEAAEKRVKPENLEEHIKALKQRRANADDGFLKKKKVKVPGWKENMFVVTTNFDNMFRKVGFSPTWISEIHGNITNWQCSVPCTPADPAMPRVWKLDPEFRFQIGDDVQAPMFKDKPDAMLELDPPPEHEPTCDAEAGCLCDAHTRFFGLAAKPDDLVELETSKYRPDNQMWVRPVDDEYRPLTSHQVPRKAIPTSAQGGATATSRTTSAMSDVLGSRASTPPPHVDVDKLRANPKTIHHMRAPSPATRMVDMRSQLGRTPSPALLNAELGAIPPPAPDNFHVSGLLDYRDGDYYVRREYAAAFAVMDKADMAGEVVDVAGGNMTGTSLPGGSRSATAMSHRSSGSASQQQKNGDADGEHPHHLDAKLIRSLEERIGHTLAVHEYDDKHALDEEQIGHVLPPHVPGSLFYPAQFFSAYLNAQGLQRIRSAAPPPLPIQVNPERNHPRCINPECKAQARPNLLMNGDDEAWRTTTSNYKKWIMQVRKTMKTEAANEEDFPEPKKLVIVELGCGPRVAHLRKVSEDLLRLTPTPGTTKLVRVNHEDYAYDGPEELQEHVISVRDRCRPAMRKINDYMEETNKSIDAAIAPLLAKMNGGKRK